MNKNIIYIGVLICFAFLASCSYNKTELPIPEDVVVEPNEVSITYTNSVKAIIDAKCANCHSATPSPSDYQQIPFLSNYSEVNDQKNRIDARALVAGTMPESSSSGGFLTTQEKDTLQMWLDQGALQ